MYSLRPATKDDHEQLRQIHHAAFHDTVSQVWGWDEDLQDRMWADYMANVVVQVVETDGEIGGFLDVTKQPDHWFIVNIAIDPSQQGKGVGTAILNDLIRQSSAVDTPLRLQVIKVNHSARSLYERLGFEVNGETDTHWKMEYVGQ